MHLFCRCSGVLFCATSSCFVLLSKAINPFFFFFEGVVFFTTEPLEDLVDTLDFSKEDAAFALVERVLRKTLFSSFEAAFSALWASRAAVRFAASSSVTKGPVNGTCSTVSP